MTDPVSAQPPFPIIYEGSATIGGRPAPDGTKITARVGTAESRPTEVKGGRYTALVVDPSLEYDHVEDVVGLTIVFFADGVRAGETDAFEEGQFLELELDLNFPVLPDLGDASLVSLWMAVGGGGAASALAGVVLLVLWPRFLMLRRR
jgi:hypothetical protein